MVNVALIFGGKSAEHEVSIISAMQILNGYTKEEINLFPLFLSKNNVWFLGEKGMESRDFINPERNKKLKEVKLVVGQNSIFSKNLKKQLIKVDYAILATHGGIGENGELLSLLSLCSIPVAGSALGQAVGFDKVVAKQICLSQKIPTLPFIWFFKAEWERMPTKIISKIKKLKFPVIIKPDRQGSSIGITVAKTMSEVVAAVNLALEFDNKIIIESALVNFREFNCACLGISGEKTLVSRVDEPKKIHDILTFEDKYLGQGKKSGKGVAQKSGSLKGMNKELLTDKKLEEKIQQISLELMRLFNLSGVVRFDYLFNPKNKRLYFNEVNTVPGSLAFYLWCDYGIDINELVTKLVTQAKTLEKNKTIIKEDFITHLISSN